MLDRSVTMVDAFHVADDVLRQGVQGVCDLITTPGLINLDFADVRTVMRDAGTALMGREAAMACTVAVEEVIEEHYASQAAQLDEDESELRDTIKKFRDEELEHKETALAEGAEQAPAYPALTAAVKTGSRLAIWLSERI